ncbi:hypothetical protein ACHAWF_014903 [Thalassiosira exigua]
MATQRHEAVIVAATLALLLFFISDGPQSTSTRIRRRRPRFPGDAISRRLVGREAIGGASTRLSHAEIRTAELVRVVQVISMPDSVRLAIEEQLATIRVDANNLNDLERFIAEAKRVVLPHVMNWDPTVLKRLQSLLVSDGPSAILLRNLPRDPYVPPTPTDGSTSLRKTTAVAEGVLLAFGELAGTSVAGYKSETQYSNPWVHEGFPYPSHVGLGSALTKPGGMAHHQDMSYHPHPPDLLGLYCLREGHDAELRTTIIDNRDILALLPEDVIAVLEQDRFQVRASEWVAESASLDTLRSRPLLISPYSIPLPVDYVNMVGLDASAEQALSVLRSAVESAPRQSVHFADGDLLLFPNRRVVHARTPYSDLRYDGGDRVVERAYFRVDWPSEEARVTRMLD